MDLQSLTASLPHAVPWRIAKHLLRACRGQGKPIYPLGRIVKKEAGARRAPAPRYCVQHGSEHVLDGQQYRPALREVVAEIDVGRNRARAVVAVGIRRSEERRVGKEC